jgi:XTP/dITP diphosphohydrolase
MLRIPVESSDLVAVGYDEPSRTLEIEFKENRVYRYFEVEPEMYKGLMKAESYGEYFFGFINRHYRYKRVGDTGKETQPQAVAFVTGNAVKVDNLRAACKPYGIEIDQLELPVDEIQSDDPEKIAVSKAKEAYRLAGRPVLIMDAFWNILALRGFPGAFMSYMNGWLKPEDFLALMTGKTDRTITVIETAVYYDGKRPKVFAKTMLGQMTTEPRGKGRHPIREIVVLEGEEKTMAELDNELGQSHTDLEQTIWHDFAKWYNFQRRLHRA